MAESYTIIGTSGGFAAVEPDLILYETPATRVVFRAQIHSDGVRGFLINQKRGRGEAWEDTKKIDFRKLKTGEGANIELPTAALASLNERYNRLSDHVAQQDVRRGRTEYVSGTRDEVIVTDANNAHYIRELLQKGYSQDFWAQLIESDPDLATRLSWSKIHSDRAAAISEFRASVFTRADDEAYWQAFFRDNPWILQSVFPSPVLLIGDDVYVGGKAPIGRQGAGGVATDYLFADEGSSSFAVGEIKTPASKLIGSNYRGETGSGLDNEIYSVHGSLTGAVIQAQNQIAVTIENFENVVGRLDSRMNKLHPHGIVVTGTANILNHRERHSFNLFRHTLHGLTVITYDELLRRSELIVGIEEDESAATSSQGIDDVSLDDIPF
jgi:hypothetical protein